MEVVPREESTMASQHDARTAARAEVPDARLAASYEYCRVLHRTYGRTYYLATRLLPRWNRRHVHALYGFTRYTDELVDGLDRADFAAFLRSMEMDLTVTEYPTYDDLLDYMEGSAAAIGTMMLPILGTSDPAAAHEPARQLGFAFQLTNFIRDVGEDLDRGRIYLPRKDLADAGVTPEDLRARQFTAPIRELIAAEVARARVHYAFAAPGIPLLAPGSQACIRTAYRLYAGILDEVERNGYDVFTRRATVPDRHRLAIAVTSLLTRPGRPVKGA